MNHLVCLGYYKKVRLGNHDPNFGWRADQRKLYAIIVRQETAFIPDMLVRQPKRDGGSLALVGTCDTAQDLIHGHKTQGGRLIERTIMPVRFTRLTGGPRF